MTRDKLATVPENASERYKDWYTRLERAMSLRWHEGKRWRENEDFEDLRQWDGDEASLEVNDDQITINLVAPYLRSTSAALAYQNPRIVVTPTQPEGWEMVRVPDIDPETGPVIDQETGQPATKLVAKYRVKEALLNAIASRPEFGLKNAIRRVIEAGHLSYGVFKTGFEGSFEDVPDKSSRVIPEDENGMPDFSLMMKKPDETFQIDADDKPVMITQQTSQKWFTRQVLPRRMLIDPDGEAEFMDHSWVAEEQWRSLADVKADRNLKNKKGLKATGKTKCEVDREYNYKDYDSSPEANSEYYFCEKDETEELVRIFEVYDMVNNKLMVMAEGHDKFLREEPIPLGIRRTPYKFFRPQERQGKFYQRPPVSDFAPLNREYNIIRQQLLKSIRKEASRKSLVSTSVVDPDILEKLNSGDDMDFIPADATPGEMQGAVQAVFTQPTSANLFNHMAVIQRDIAEVSTQPGEARGVADSDTATQAGIVAGYDNLRTTDLRNMLAETLQGVAEDLDASVMANMELPEVVHYVGSDGLVLIGEISKDMLESTSKVSVDIKDMRPRAPEMEAVRMMEALRIFTQDPEIILDEEFSAAVFEKLGIHDKRVSDGIVKTVRAKIERQQQMVQEQRQFEMVQGAQDNVGTRNGNQPSTGQRAAESPADAASLRGGE